MIKTADIMFLSEWLTRKSFIALIDKNDWNAIKADLKELMASMKSIGLIQPIGVCEAGSSYLLLFGLRRLIAAKLLGWKKLSVLFTTNHNFHK